MKLIKLAFNAFCVSLTIYMSVLQALRLRLNEDFSTITFRQFNEDSQDQYPAITFCIEKYDACSRASIYDKDILNNSFGLDSCQFESFLKGEAEGLEGIDLSNAIQGNFEDVSMKVENIFINGYTVNNMDVQVNKWHSKDENKKDQIIPMFVSHQKPEGICISTKPSFQPGYIRSIDHFNLNQTYLNLYGYLKVRVITYLPGQVIQALSKKPKYIGTLETHDTHKYVWTFSLSQIMVVRKRKTSKRPCTKEVDNDKVLREKVMREAGCIPQYWKSITTHLNLPDCHSLPQLKQIDDIISNSSKFRFMAYQPCDNMALETNLEKTRKAFTWGWKILSIAISYEEDTYQEVTNRQDFSFESFWSSVGGFIGIFMGYSLLQVPELLADIYTCLKAKIVKAISMWLK